MQRHTTLRSGWTSTTTRNISITGAGAGEERTQPSWKKPKAWLAIPNFLLARFCEKSKEKNSEASNQQKKRENWNKQDQQQVAVASEEQKPEPWSRGGRSDIGANLENGADHLVFYVSFIFSSAFPPQLGRGSTKIHEWKVNLQRFVYISRFFLRYNFLQLFT